MSLRNLGLSTLALSVVTLTLSLFAPRHLHAQTDSGALVLQGCPNNSTFYGRSDGYTYQVCADIVFTPTGDVNATFHGTLLDPTSAPSQALIVSGFPCAYNNQTTHDSQLVISPDGTVNGFCKLHTN